MTITPSLGRRAALAAAVAVPVGSVVAFGVSLFAGVPLILAGAVAGILTLAAVHHDARPAYGRAGAAGFYLTVAGLAFLLVPFMQLLAGLAVVGFPMFLFALITRTHAYGKRLAVPLVTGAAAAWAMSFVLEQYEQSTEPALVILCVGIGATFYELGRALDRPPPPAGQLRDTRVA